MSFSSTAIRRRSLRESPRRTFAVVLVGLVFRALGDAIGKAMEGRERAKAEREKAQLYRELLEQEQHQEEER